MGSTVKRSRVNVYREYLLCDCNLGINEMHIEADLLTGSQYRHRCSVCEQVVVVAHVYPRTIYKEDEPDDY
jgi:hypothetical protein